MLYLINWVILVKQPFLLVADSPRGRIRTAAAETRGKNQERSEREREGGGGWTTNAPHIVVVLVVKADFWSLCTILFQRKVCSVARNINMFLFTLPLSVRYTKQYFTVFIT